jgi:hypothetical protein
MNRDKPLLSNPRASRSLRIRQIQRAVNQCVRCHADFVVRDASNSRTAKWGCFQPGWALSLIDIPLTEFNQSIIKYPNIKRFPGGASNDMIPNPQNPENPLPYGPTKVSKTIGAGGG